MSEVIQCPTCAKKFRLPATPPAEFTCTSCATVMDLSGFGAPAEPAMAAAPAAAGGAAPATRRARAGGRRRGGRARGGARRARGHARGGHDDHDDDGQGHGGYRKKDNNTAVVIGSIAGLALAAVLVIVLMNQKDDAPPEDPAKPGKTTAGTGTGTGQPTVLPTPLDPTGAMPGQPGGTTPIIPGTPGANPGAAPSDPNPTPKRISKTRPRIKNITLETFDWPDEVDAATRAAAEEHLENMVEVGGRDGRDGEEWFIKQGRKLCGRLISEFPSIVERDGMGRMGMTKLMVLDRVLSSIDGTLEREWRSRQRITHVTDEKLAMSRLKRWTWWWKSGLWKEAPVKPWDPRTDEIDEEAKKKKEEDAGKGFGKRAGK